MATSYIIGLPVEVTVHDDGRVAYSVDLSDAPVAIRDDEENTYGEDRVTEDTRVVEAWLATLDSTWQGTAAAVAADIAHAALEAEFRAAFAALREAGIEHDADHPTADRYRAASDAVNHSHRKREAGR